MAESATKVLDRPRIGPHLDLASTESEKDAGWSEVRDIHFIEADIAKEGGLFSFVETLHALRKQFSDAPALNILSGGSGEGADLGDMKQLSEAFDIPLKTTAVTLARRNEPALREAKTDKIITDSVQDAFYNGELKPPYHFIVDICGAIGYDKTPDPDWQAGGRGEAIIPIYARLLPKGGKLLFVVPDDLTDENTHQGTRLVKMLHENGLQITYTSHGKGVYILAEKQTEEPVYVRAQDSELIYNITKRGTAIGRWENELERYSRLGKIDHVLSYGVSDTVYKPEGTPAEEYMNTFIKEKTKDADAKETEMPTNREKFLTKLGCDKQLLSDMTDSRWKVVSHGKETFWYTPTQRKGVYIVRSVEQMGEQFFSVPAFVSEHIVYAPSEEELQLYFS